MPLKETTTTESETVTLQCEVSKPNKKVTWFKGGTELHADERFEIVAEETVHALKIKDTKLSDQAEYMAKIEDGDETSAMLFVQGIEGL